MSRYTITRTATRWGILDTKDDLIIAAYSNDEEARREAEKLNDEHRHGVAMTTGCCVSLAVFILFALGYLLGFTI